MFRINANLTGNRTSVLVFRKVKSVYLNHRKPKNCLKELRDDIFSHFLRVGKPKNSSFLREEKHQRGDSKTKRNEDGRGRTRLKQIGNGDFEKI